MVRGLAKLVGAQVGIFCQAWKYRAGGDWTIKPLFDFGWAGEEERRWNMSFFDGEQLDDPLTCRFVHLSGPVTTVSRPQLVDSRQWYRSPNVNELRRRARVDHCIYSTFRLDENGRAISFALHRPWGDRPFRARDVAVVDLFHRTQQIYRRNAVGAAPIRGLSPRQRQVLDCLEAGDGEKQVAARLGISRHTVHVHVKALYAHFGVSSRGELLAYTLRESGPCDGWH